MEIEVQLTGAHTVDVSVDIVLLSALSMENIHRTTQCYLGISQCSCIVCYVRPLSVQGGNGFLQTLVYPCLDVLYNVKLVLTCNHFYLE